MNTNNNMNKSTWLITAKTNLHVGDECSTGYGLIDKSVQRDALMKFPCINSSSLKGALNEYATQVLGMSSKERKCIFGSDKKGKGDSQKGTTLFFDAYILFLPEQDDNELFKLAYCDEVIDSFIEKANMFGHPIEKDAFFTMINNVTNKGLSQKGKEEFIQLCSNDELPIIARNVLENGESKNLWYEQVIPAETIFATFTQSPDPEPLENAINGKIVQIGANATIGYGYCKFTKI